MSSSKLVSIVATCYNSEKYIKRLLESVLAQTYDNIEFIIINDGSDDESEEIIMSYKNRFDERGIRFVYHYQDNMGVSGATEQGMKRISGEYVTWIDSDDWMTDDSIKIKVEHIEKNPECALVCGKVQMIDEYDTGKEVGILDYTEEARKNVFESILMCEGVYYAPVGYMARVSALRSVIKDMEIFKNKDVGQNWQLLLPLSYAYKTDFIDTIVGYYLVRAKSHSHFENTALKVIEYNNNCQLVITETLKKMSISEEDRSRYSDAVVKKYGNDNLRLYARNGYASEAKELYGFLRKKKLLAPKSYAYYAYGLIRGDHSE